MRRLKLFPVVFLLFSIVVLAAEQKYQKPPKEVLDVLNTPATPQVTVSPTRDYMVVLQGVRHPPIADLAQPMLRVAGLRIDPKTNGPHGQNHFVSMTLKKIADGKEIKIATPPNARLGMAEWSPDGKRFAFTNTTAAGIELWVGNTATGAVHKLPGVRVNAAQEPVRSAARGGGRGGARYDAVRWMPDNQTLLVQLVPAGRGALPPAPTVPVGPNIQESAGVKRGAQTYEDLLKNPHDERLFEYYATSQLAWVNTAAGAITPIGRPSIFQAAQPSPDAKFLLVARVHGPYSYSLPHSSFPKEVEVWDPAGKVVHKLVSLPLAETLPPDAVAPGPRQYAWRPTEPATLLWAEALDGGDPKQKATHRDRVLMLKAPFNGTPLELARTEHRFMGLQWGEKEGMAILSDYNRTKRYTRSFLLNVDNPAQAPRLLWNRSMADRYNDPGRPESRALPNGQRVILQKGEFIYLTGDGSSPEGDRPFLDRFSLTTLKSERLFRCDSKSYESVIALLDDNGSRIITHRESHSDPPNYYLRSGDGTLKALTQFPDRTPQLRAIEKQLVTYKRNDGVQLSFTLYLPPDYKEGTRLPTVMWSYPREYDSPDTAGQIAGSTQRFTTISGMSHLFFLLQGYAVLDNATLPVVGDPQTANDTYIEQIVAGAKAAIQKATEMGVTDPERVGVGGHSYGSFMTANLLAHSKLFRAGIARSGAHNRTLTPFGFQNERRTLWEAPEIYLKMSPFMYADKIKDPLLLIHGEADNNTGTFPIQSERMYEAVRGNGGIVRLVMLPHEAHGYAARESIEHTLYEMIAWFNKYVKNAAPRTEKAVASLE